MAGDLSVWRYLIGGATRVPSKRQTVAISDNDDVVQGESGDMDEFWTRIAENMMGRVTGPMKFRLLLQPTMAVLFAIRAGLADAKSGRPPYFWTFVTDSTQRAYMLRDGWKSVGKVFVLAVVLDVVYQIIVEGFVYPGEVIVVAFALAIVPYLLVRGLVTRLARPKASDGRR